MNKNVESALNLVPFNINAQEEAWSRLLATTKVPNMVDDTFIGLEVEVERVFKTSHTLKLPSGAFVWNNIEDGSLRNNGREFVSIPIKGKQIPIALRGLFLSLKKDTKTIGYEFTDRTSVHVHVNVRDMQLEHLYNFVLVYLLVEDILYDFVGNGRKNNIFCVPIKESNFDWELRDLLSCLSHKDKWVDVEAIRNWQKYTGFNMLPMLDKGTIEFRHMGGTDDEEKLLTWINAILRLKQYASTISSEKLLDYINTLNTSSDYGAFLSELFGGWFDYSFYFHPDKALEQSIMFLKKVLYSHEYTEQYIQKFSSEGNLVHDVYTGKVRKEFLAPLLSQHFIKERSKDSKKKGTLGSYYQMQANQWGDGDVQFNIPPPVPGGARPLADIVAEIERDRAARGRNPVPLEQVVVLDDVDF